MHKTALVLNQTGDGEGRRAAARRITSYKKVLRILVGSASVKGDGRSFSCEHGLHLAKREGLLCPVGGNAERLPHTEKRCQIRAVGFVCACAAHLAKQHGRVLHHTTRRRMLGVANMLTEECV